MALKDYSSQERSIDYLNPHHYASSLISSSTIKHREVADYWLQAQVRHRFWRQETPPWP
jgi:hypothetical protein